MSNKYLEKIAQAMQAVEDKPRPGFVDTAIHHTGVGTLTGGIGGAGVGALVGSGIRKGLSNVTNDDAMMSDLVRMGRGAAQKMGKTLPPISDSAVVAGARPYIAKFINAAPLKRLAGSVGLGAGLAVGAGLGAGAGVAHGAYRAVRSAYDNR